MRSWATGRAARRATGRRLRGRVAIVQVAFSIGLPRVRRGPDGACEGRRHRVFRCICSNSANRAKAAVAVAAAAGIACAAAPAAERTHTIAPGVTVLGARVGGLAALPAEHRIERAVARPIRIVYRGETFGSRRGRWGSRPASTARCARALAATPRSRIGLPVRFSDDGRRRATSTSSRSSSDARLVNAEIVGATASGPILREGHLGLAVERKTMRAAIAQQLASGSRAPLALMMSAVPPAQTPATFGPIVVIDRGANTLKLYRATRARAHVQRRHGHVVLPDAVRRVQDREHAGEPVVDAAELRLGARPRSRCRRGRATRSGRAGWASTRPGVGMHGTPDDASIGYSRSHGCIRMHIPDAEWLFEHVEVGTPVVIL